MSLDFCIQFTFILHDRVQVSLSNTFVHDLMHSQVYITSFKPASFATDHSEVTMTQMHKDIPSSYFSCASGISTRHEWKWTKFVEVLLKIAKTNNFPTSFRAVYLQGFVGILPFNIHRSKAVTQFLSTCGTALVSLASFLKTFGTKNMWTFCQHWFINNTVAIRTQKLCGNIAIEVFQVKSHSFSYYISIWLGIHGANSVLKNRLISYSQRTVICAGLLFLLLTQGLCVISSVAKVNTK